LSKNLFNVVTQYLLVKGTNIFNILVPLPAKVGKKRTILPQNEVCCLYIYK
jgi:hypothetical protein